MPRLLRCLPLLALLAGVPVAQAAPGPAPAAPKAPPAPAAEQPEAVLPEAASELLTESPGALDRLRDRLEVLDNAVHSGAPVEPLRVTQIGDSHTEAGFFSRALGKLLAPGQHISPGYLWPDMLAPGDVEVVKLGRRKDWREESWLDPHAQGPFGPRGVAFVASQPGATLELRTHVPLPAGTRLTVLYAPLSGSAELRDGAKMLARIVRPEPPQPSTLARIEVPWPAHATELRLVADDPAADGEGFRVYGFLLDRPDAVLTYDVLGARGTTSEHPLKRDDGALLELLRLRPPDLLVVWFGSNSAVSRPFQPDSFHQSFNALLERLREAAPDAPLLVIGPPDLERRPEGCPSWAFQKKRRLYPHEREALRRFACAPETAVVKRPGKPSRFPAEGIKTEQAWQDFLERCDFATLPSIELITQAERDAALAANGMFFDTYEFMGGPGAIHHWACELPQLGEFDHVHLTPEGHARLAEGVRDALRTGSR